MKRGILSLLIILISLVCPLYFIAHADDSTTPEDVTPDYTWYGDGSSSIYDLNDVNDLFGFSDIVNGTAESISKDSFNGKTVRLNSDINLTDLKWTPIGSSMYGHSSTDSNNTKKFEGTFDGNNHTITGLNSSEYIPLPEDVKPVDNEYSFGLFGYAYGANIKNIKLSNVAINCCTITLSDSRNADGSGVAALIGYYVPKDNATSVIDNCHVLSGTVIASNNMGGLIGFMEVQNSNIQTDVTIKNCSNASAVTTKAREAGGIIGLLQLKSNINQTSIKFINCNNSGNITAENKGGCCVAGGILGRENSNCNSSAQILFDTCSNSGTISINNPGNLESHASGIGTSYLNVGPWLIAKNCSNIGNIILAGNKPNHYAGGIFSYAPYATLDNCSTTATITKGDANNLQTYVDRTLYRLYLNEMDSSCVTGNDFITFMLNRGSTIFPPGTTLSTEPIRTGYTFGGWYTNDTITTPATTYDNGNTYYAKWTANGYTVKFDANGGTGNSIADKHFTYDDPSQSLPPNTYTRTNYIFIGWNTAPDGSGDAFEDQKVKPNVTTTGEITLYAHWIKLMNITYQGMNGATHGSNPPQNHTYNTATPIPNPSKPGYIFDGWKINQSEETYKDLTLGATDYTDDITLCATWIPLDLTGTVKITGTAKVGKKLVASVNNSNNTGTFIYKWYRYNETATLISETTNNTYTITEQDIKCSIYCVVTSNAQTGNIESEKVGPVPLMVFTNKEVSSDNLKITYDGNTPSITFSVPDGATVYYSIDGVNFDLTEIPKYEEAGEYTLYYMVKKDNYETTTGSLKINIEEPTSDNTTNQEDNDTDNNNSTTTNNVGKDTANKNSSTKNTTSDNKNNNNKSPLTGDTYNLLVYIISAILSILGILVLTTKKFKH